MQGDAPVRCTELPADITSVLGMFHPFLKECSGTATSPELYIHVTYFDPIDPSPGPSDDLHKLNHRLSFAVTPWVSREESDMPELPLLGKQTKMSTILTVVPSQTIRHQEPHND